MKKEVNSQIQQWLVDIFIESGASLASNDIYAAREKELKIWKGSKYKDNMTQYNNINNIYIRRHQNR